GPLGHALVIALLVLLVGSLQLEKLLGLRESNWPLLTAIGLGALLLCLEWHVLRTLGIAPVSEAGIAALMGTLFFCAAPGGAPGVVGALGVLLLGHHRRDVLLMGLASAALLLFGAAFYYQLHLTLLAKAGVLCASGGVLLALRPILFRDRAP